MSKVDKQQRQAQVVGVALVGRHPDERFPLAVEPPQTWIRLRRVDHLRTIVEQATILDGKVLKVEVVHPPDIVGIALGKAQDALERQAEGR